MLAGYLLGDNWHLVEGYAGMLQNVVIVACVAAAGLVRRVPRAAGPARCP